MKYYCNPMNLEYRYQYSKMERMGQEDSAFKLYREAADPSLVKFGERYYLFTSMTAGFYSSTDLISWEFYTFQNKMPIYDYAPDVCVMGEYLYFSASKRGENCPFYRTKDPINEPFEEIEGTFAFWDPHLFYDDDGRVYFYWGCSNDEPIYGVELDKETMKPLGEPQIMFDSADDKRGYERMGEDHIPPKSEEEIEQSVQMMLEQSRKIPAEQLKQMGVDSLEEVEVKLRAVMGNAPYIEGAWMTKYQDKYYLQYAIPGTQYNVYGDGVFVSDSPLGPYHLAENNPYSYKPGGFITGAGHGSTLKEKEDSYWHTSTMRISHLDSFERRIGLWKAGFDKEGNLYCDQRYGDWPIHKDKKPFTNPEWMLLSYGKPVTASSGEGLQNVTDENIRTWWKADTNNHGEWIELDLGEAMSVHAIQINFADDTRETQLPQGVEVFDAQQVKRYLDLDIQATRWRLEASEDGKHYVTLEDKRAVETDYAHDFLVWEEGKKVRYLRLTIESLPYNQVPCVSGIRVFGLGNGSLPNPCQHVKVEGESDLDMLVTWEGAANAVGYNILWGFGEDKLYHSYMVFGKNQQRIGALVKGQPVYVRVDTFNEKGITEGNVQKLEA